MSTGTVGSTVVDAVVAADICIGCGVCAGLCPSGFLEMRLTEGEYKPYTSKACTIHCGLCLNICPFGNHDVGLDELARQCFASESENQLSPEVGYYSVPLLGYSCVDGHRDNGASGGMVTFILQELFRRGEIDGAVCVQHSVGAASARFEMAILKSAAEVRAAASSKYCPTECSKVIYSILHESEDRQYAIVALPCFASGIRRAIKAIPRLRRRVKYILGLVCGSCPSMYYSELLCAWVGVRSGEVKQIEFRHRDGVVTGTDYQFRVQRHDGTWSRQVGFEKAYRYLWGRCYFRHNACLYCDDVFAELADAAFMDAWLPRLAMETKGTSIVVSRNRMLSQILEDAIKDQTCHLERITIGDVVTSQSAQITFKREQLKKRIAWAQRMGRHLPTLRTPAASEITADDIRDLRCCLNAIRWSKQLWRWFRLHPALGTAPFFFIVDTLIGGPRYALLTTVRLSGLARSLHVWLRKVFKYGRTPN